MDELQRQALNVTPPRRGQGFNLTIDSTARKYDFTGLAWGGTPYRQGEVEQDLFLVLHNDSTSASPIFFRFREDTGSADLDETVVVAAGGTLALSNTGACGEISVDGFAEVRIDRNLDKFLEVKCASGGSATLRVTLSSQQNK